MHTPVHLGNNISRLRGFKRLTQKEMAARLNIRQQDYSKIEKKAKVDETLLISIATILEISVDLIHQLDTNAIITLRDVEETKNHYVIAIEKLEKLYERLLESERKRNQELEYRIKIENTNKTAVESNA